MDVDVLFDPEHPEFSDSYALENEEKENVREAIKYKMLSRKMNIGLAFVTYHLVKTGLWHYGYGAHFFYRTRFLSFPLLFASIYYSTNHIYPGHLEEAGILDYSMRRSQFEKDTHLVQQLLKGRQEVIESTEKDKQSSINIDKLINKR